MNIFMIGISIAREYIVLTKYPVVRYFHPNEGRRSTEP